MSGRGHAAAWVVVVACAPHVAPGPEFPGGVEIPLTITDGGTVLVPVAIGDASGLPFVLDTGASITALTAASAAELGVAADGTVTVYDSRGTNPEAALATVARLGVGSEDHMDVRVAIVDLPAAGDLDSAFAGVLGLDVLRHHDVVIDLGRRSLGLHPAGAVARSPEVIAMARTGFRAARDDLVQLAVGLDDHESIAAILDLGSQGSVVNTAAAELLASASIIDTARSSTGADATHDVGLRRAREIRVGTVAFRHRVVWVADLPVFARAGLADRPAILLGADLFAGRTLALAFADHALYISR